ncbi:hypothetical protein [Aneurinibacillus sp. Ricciae_BoGa-3]|uniref:hypothetical protein n=1 Tax=Aneurinibacillus sp. Ricciae_BoGa-3 TaxID=3022697 RepID=UPI002FEE4E8D
MQGDRVATVQAELVGSDVGTVAKLISQKLPSLSIPNGYKIETVGDLKKQGER